MKKRKIMSVLWVVLLFIGTYPQLYAEPKDQVSVAVKILNQNGNPDQIPFDQHIPLKVSDFLGKPDRRSHGVAATRSGIEMNISGRKQNNQVTIEVELFVYFDKSKSRMKEEGKNVRILNHEQHHLDITALQFCNFVREIRSYPFSADGWNAELKHLYSRNMQELQERQNRYDRQTQHGTKQETQAAYDREITGELKAMDCFNK